MLQCITDNCYYILCCSPDVDSQTHRADLDSLENSFGNLLSNNDSSR